MYRPSHLAAALLAGALVCGGCISSGDKAKQLARVAKDWCLTIRASQIIPTYPLTEDLLPGDVFLTSTPLGEELELFREKGFLPLDNHLVRLGADEVFRELEGFYSARFVAGAGGFPEKIGWDRLPDVKFPTYTFEVSRSGGLNLALPIQGVPVGLNYLGAAKATGSVAISEAQTVGADIDRLNPVLDRWAAQRVDLLRPFGSMPGDPEAMPVFLRIVTRIFYTGKVSLHLADSTTSGAEAAAGADLPLDLPEGDSLAKSAAERRQDLAANLNTSLDGKYGGRLRIVNATSRTITLDEDFTRPVVIGYLAYDRQILPDGTLGPPVSTLVRVSGRTTIDPRLVGFDSANYITAWYTRDEVKRAPVLARWLADNYPGVAMSVFISQDSFEDARLRMIQEVGIR